MSIKERPIQSSKKAYPLIFNGSTRQHNPGDRGGDIRKSSRFGKNMRPEALPRLKEFYGLSIKELTEILDCGKSTVQSMLGKRKTGRNFPVSKKSFWKIVEAVEPSDYFEGFNNAIGEIENAIPVEIENLVFQFSSKKLKRAE